MMSQTMDSDGLSFASLVAAPVSLFAHDVLILLSFLILGGLLAGLSIGIMAKQILH